MAILLIRHGETAWNAARIVQLPETPLNERGLDQAARLAQRLRAFDVRRIVASDYARTQMTAQAISEATGVAVESHVGLRERNFGDYRGRAFAEFEENIFAPDHEPPNGESLKVFHERVAREWPGITEMAQGTEGNLAVVSHALWNRYVVEHHFGITRTAEGEPLRWPNTSLTVIEGPPWAPTLVASASHLEEPAVAHGKHPAGI